jgi:polyphosphate kinase
MVFPVLTPHAVDASRPFPHISDKTLNLGVFSKKDVPEAEKFFCNCSNTFYSSKDNLPSGQSKTIRLFLLEDLITMYIEDLFLGHSILSVNPYRIYKKC